MAVNNPGGSTPTIQKIQATQTITAATSGAMLAAVPSGYKEIWVYFDNATASGVTNAAVRLNSITSASYYNTARTTSAIVSGSDAFLTLFTASAGTSGWSGWLKIPTKRSNGVIFCTLEISGSTGVVNLTSNVTAAADLSTIDFYSSLGVNCTFDYTIYGVI